MKLSEAVKRVMALAGKVHDYYEAELPKRHRNYPLIEPDEETAPPPPEEKELRDFLASLPEDLVYQLVVLMDLGRAHIGTDDLASYYAEVKDSPGGAAYWISQLMYQAPLADYLQYSLEELSKQHLDVDKLSLKKVKVRKR